jgi:hypothetical protein
MFLRRRITEKNPSLGSRGSIVLQTLSEIRYVNILQVQRAISDYLRNHALLFLSGLNWLESFPDPDQLPRRITVIHFLFDAVQVLSEPLHAVWWFPHSLSNGECSFILSFRLFRRAFLARYSSEANQ